MREVFSSISFSSAEPLAQILEKEKKKDVKKKLSLLNVFFIWETIGLEKCNVLSLVSPQETGKFKNHFVHFEFLPKEQRKFKKTNRLLFWFFVGRCFCLRNDKTSDKNHLHGILRCSKKLVSEVIYLTDLGNQRRLAIAVWIMRIATFLWGLWRNKMFSHIEVSEIFVLAVMKGMHFKSISCIL